MTFQSCFAQRWFARIACAAIIVIPLASCSGDNGTPATTSTTNDADASRPTVAFVTHQEPDDTFWDMVRTGAEAAAARDNIELQYSFDADAAKQAALVREAVNNDVDGIVVTLAAPDALASAVRAATAAEIPVIAVNSGIAEWKALV